MWRNIIVKLLQFILPSAVFFICYLFIGILPAIIVSAIITVSVMIYELIKHKKVTNSQILGLLGLFLSFVAIYFTGNEKLYYVPALIENCVFACFMVVLTAKKMSVFHYITKDFNIRSVKIVPESELMLLNILWVAFFIVKITSKVVGILWLEFETLYWLVFALGDPMNIAIFALSVFIINRKIRMSRITQENG